MLKLHFDVTTNQTITTRYSTVNDLQAPFPPSNYNFQSELNVPNSWHAPFKETKSIPLYVDFSFTDNSCKGYFIRPVCSANASANLCGLSIYIIQNFGRCRDLLSPRDNSSLRIPSMFNEGAK